MLKKINLVVVSFFSVLTVLLDIGFVLYIPIIFFYLLKEYKNIYYIIPSSLISLALFTGTSYLLEFGILMILVLFIIWIMTKITKGYYMYVIIGLLNITTYVILYKGFPDAGKFIILMILSILLYIYFEKNLIDFLKINKYLYNQTYSEIIVGVIAILGALKVQFFNINLGFVLAVYLAMYASHAWKNIYALLYSLIVMVIEVLFFNIQEALFIPFIVSFYFLPFVYPVVIVNIFSLSIILLNTGYQDELMLTIMGVSLIFELLKKFIIKDYLKDEVVREEIYTQVASNVSSEVLSFAEFLDKFAEGFKTPKEYNDKISEALKTIVQRHCNKCPRKKECFSQNKNTIYPHFRSLLLQKDLYNHELRTFLNNCSYSKDICETAKNLNYRIDFDKSGSNNNALIAQVTGVASAIRQYAIDMISKEEVNYALITTLKQRLISYGYDVTYFEIKRSFINDFLFIVGLRNVNKDEAITEIKMLSDSILDVPVTVNQEGMEDGVIYFQIIPEIKLDILYGYGSLSSEGNNICGDNYIIKNLKNGKFITAISDGMGKGYSAFYESNMTLNLVNDIIELNLDSSTSLEILNTFYAIQDYLERYATLDLLEINRYTKEAKFYKMGGTTTYIIKNNGKIDKIVNQNLPFGIDDNIENYDYHLDNGDLILMSSDGIFENIIEDKQLEKFLFKIKEETPQKIVYELLNYTMNQKLKTTDDMTLIALKVKMA